MLICVYIVNIFYVHKQHYFQNQAYMEFCSDVTAVLAHQICKTSRVSTVRAVNLVKTDYLFQREHHDASCSLAQMPGVLCSGKTRFFQAWLKDWALCFLSHLILLLQSGEVFYTLAVRQGSLSASAEA